MTNRDLLFSVTRRDFRFEDTKGSGNGGQKKNKTSSAMRCTHIASGAVGYAEEDRMQGKNKVLAFNRCVATPKFQAWLELETARRSGAAAAAEADIQRRVDQQMRPANLLIEVPGPDGEWTELADVSPPGYGGTHE